MEEDEERGAKDLENDDDEADSIFDDPDFAHMSDSDLDDKLPLFEGEDSEDEDESDEGLATM